MFHCVTCFCSLQLSIKNNLHLFIWTCKFSIARAYHAYYTTMPLWSNEEWRVRIGSSWCATGRSLKCNSSISHQREVLGYLQLSVSAGTMLRCGFLMTVIGIITGYNLLTNLLASWIVRCRRAIKGMKN